MNAMADVAKPAVYSVVITILVFLPLMTLEDIEGKMFRPVVVSLCFMLAGALFYALVLVPAWTAYSRVWERCAAAFLTLYVVAACVGLGLVGGGAIVWFWDRIQG